MIEKNEKQIRKESAFLFNVRHGLEVVFHRHDFHRHYDFHRHDLGVVFLYVHFLHDEVVVADEDEVPARNDADAEAEELARDSSHSTEEHSMACNILHLAVCNWDMFLQHPMLCN